MTTAASRRTIDRGRESKTELAGKADPEFASAAVTVDRITTALGRGGSMDTGGIGVVAVGTRVTLTGTVHSWLEKKQVIQAAWSSPHVSDVDVRLRVRTV